jgi:hypothetical protein
LEQLICINIVVIVFFTDLKSNFTQISSSPSTHGSGIGQVSLEEDENEQGIITEFNPDHIISDPGLRIPIDQFAHDIRDEVRRAFIEKDPTQPTGHNFPKA